MIGGFSWVFEGLFGAKVINSGRSGLLRGLASSIELYEKYNNKGDLRGYKEAGSRRARKNQILPLCEKVDGKRRTANPFY